MSSFQSGRNFFGLLAGILLVFVVSVPDASAATFTTTIPDTYWCVYNYSTGTTDPPNCDTVEVTLTLDKTTYLPGESIVATGAMRLLNPLSGSNNLLTYYKSGFEWALTYHAYSMTVTTNGSTKTLFDLPYGMGWWDPVGMGSCKRTGACPASGTATLTAPSTAGTYYVSCDALISQAMDAYGIPDFVASIPSTTCRVSYTVAAAAQPNLTFGPINETTAVAGQSKVFTALLSNTGTASTTSAFYNLLQRATGYNSSTRVASGVSDVQWPLHSGRLGPAVRSTTFSFGSYTVPAADAGTVKYFRACADRSSGAGANQLVAESDENDNCGDWTAVQITAAPQANIIALNTTPSAASPVVGTNVTFSAQVKNIGTASAGPVPNGFQLAFNTTKTAPYTWLTATQVSTLGVPNGVANIVSGSSYSTSTASTYYVRACGNYTVSGSPLTGTRNTAISESSTTDNCDTNWVPVTVTLSPDAGKANLRVYERVAPLTGTVGVATTYTVPVYNTSTDTDVTEPFYALIQKTNAIDASGNPTGPVSDMNVVGVTTDVLRSSSATLSVPITWIATDAGQTRYARICADKSTAADMDGSIVESNPEDNCGEWTPISIASGTLTVPDCTITSGNSSCTVSASWSVSNASGPSIRNQITNLVYSLTGSSGSQSVALNGPPGSVNFDLRSTQNGVTTVLATDPGVASCAAGTSWSGGQCAAFQCTGSIPAGGVMYSGDDTSLTSTLAYAYAAQPGTARKCEYYCSAGTVYTGGTCLSAPVTTLTATPSRVPKGTNTTVTWSATNGATCSVSRVPASAPWPVSGNPGSQSDTVNVQTVYTATCTNAAGSDTKSVTVNILPDFTEF